MKGASRTVSFLLLSFLLVLQLLAISPWFGFQGAMPLAAATPEPQGMRDLSAYKAFYGYASEDMDESYRRLHVVGLEDDTTVYLYDVGGVDVEGGGKARLVAEVNVDRMGVHEWSGRNVPTYFKIVADKPVVAAVFSFGLLKERGFATFYPTVNGSFVGRDFIFEANRGSQPSYAGDVYIFAVEKADRVDIYNSSGLVTTLSVPANTHYILPEHVRFNHMTVYHVNSTGDIMIRQSPNEGVTFSPSINGNFVGKTHFGLFRGYGFVIPLEPGTTELYNMATGELNATHTFTEAGDLWWWEYPEAVFPFYTVSTGNVIVCSGWSHNGMPKWHPGYIGGLYSEEGAEYWVKKGPTGKIVVFANSETELTVNEESHILYADEHYAILEEGVYHIVSSKTLTIIVHYQAYSCWGSYLLSPSDMPIAHPEIAGGDMTNMYIYVSVAAAVVVIAAIVILKRRKP